MHVALVTPSPRHLQAGLIGPSGQEDLRLAYAAACLRRAGHQATLLHGRLQRLGRSDLADLVAALEAGLIVLGSSYEIEMLWDALRLIHDLRARGLDTPVALVGFMANVLAGQVAWHCDSQTVICLGEAEATVVDLAHQLAERKPWRTVPGLVCAAGNRVMHTAPRSTVCDLDNLPWPARDLLPLQLAQAAGHQRAALVESSRGCHNGCAFCAQFMFYGSSRGSPTAWRARSPEDTVDELKHLMAHYAPSEIHFSDINFVGPGMRGKSRALTIAQEIVRRGLVCRLAIQCRAEAVADEMLMTALCEAGLVRVGIGVESGSQQVLDRYDKQLTVETNRRALDVVDRLGLEATLEFILFDPWTTLDELHQTLDFIRQTRVHRWIRNPYHFVNTLMPYAGTPIHARVMRSVRLIPVLGGTASGAARWLAFYLCADARVDLVRKGMLSLVDRYQTVRSRLVALHPLSGEALSAVQEHQRRVQAWQDNVGELLVTGLERLLAEVERRRPTGDRNGRLVSVIAGVLDEHGRRYLGPSWEGLLVEDRSALTERIVRGEGRRVFPA